jgi:superfamily II DNA or RNA helicase
MFHTRTVSSAVSDVDLIVIDEAHRAASGSYQTIVYSLPWAKVLGLTATPWRLDGQPLGDTFSAMVVLGQQTELIAEGFLSAPLTYGIPQEKAREMLRGVKGNGEYSQKQLSAAMRKPSLMGDIVEHWKKRADGQRTIVFAVNHEHARALTQRFADAGIKVAYLNTEILAHAERREALLRALKNDDIQVLVNVDALSEGFDCPSVKCIVLARPTKSLTRFLQQCGRGSRPFKGRRVVVLDHAGNCRRFGRPHEDREWSLVEGVTSSGSSKPLTKVCVNEDCLAEIPMGSVQCHECGADQPARARDLSESTGELVLLCASEQAKRKMEDDLRKLAKQKGLSEDWVKKAIRRAA